MATTLVNGAEMPIFAIDTDFNAPEKISFIGIGQKDAAASGGEKAVEAAKAAGWDKIEAAYIAGVQGDSSSAAAYFRYTNAESGAMRVLGRIFWLTLRGITASLFLFGAVTMAAEWKRIAGPVHKKIL